MKQSLYDMGMTYDIVTNGINRFFSLAEQCHTQNFYIRCFKLDLDDVKSKFDLNSLSRLRRQNLRIKMTSKTMSTSKIKMPSKMKTISK